MAVFAKVSCALLPIACHPFVDFETINPNRLTLAADRLRAQTLDRVDDLAALGHRFRDFLEREGWWYFEARRFLKGGSRVISLADYNVEKALVLAGPHRVLIGVPEELPA